jgi:DNA-binding protein Alba
MQEIFIGQRNAMEYILNIVSRCSNDEGVVLLSRGRNNARALDVFAILSREYIKSAKITECKVTTEEFGEENEKRRTTALELDIKW